MHTPTYQSPYMKGCCSYWDRMLTRFQTTDKLVAKTCGNTVISDFLQFWFHPSFSEGRRAGVEFYYFCVVFFFCLLYCLSVFLLFIVLSARLWFTVSDDLIGIFKIFWVNLINDKTGIQHSQPINVNILHYTINNNNNGNLCTT